jgi:hypothetical protein
VIETEDRMGEAAQEAARDPRLRVGQGGPGQQGCGCGAETDRDLLHADAIGQRPSRIVLMVVPPR